MCNTPNCMFYFIFSALGSFSDFPRTYSRKAGESLRIICPKPKSFPEGTVIWYEYGSEGWVKIDYNDRITIDPDGKSDVSLSFWCMYVIEFLVDGRKNLYVKLPSP